MTAVGIDVGGTKCHGVVVDEKGFVISELRYPTPHASELIALLGNMFRELWCQIAHRRFWWERIAGFYFVCDKCNREWRVMH